MWKRVSAIFCESERIPQNTNRIPVFSKSSHRIRRPSEYHARIPRGTAQNTQKNTVFFIVFRIRQRIRYFTCRIPTSIAFAAFARPCGQLLDEGDRARLCVNWVAILIQGGGTTVASTFFASGAFFSSALLSFLLTASVEMPAPLPSSFCFPAGLLVFFFSCRQWEVGVRERRPHMRGREDSMHCEL